MIPVMMEMLMMINVSTLSFYLSSYCFLIDLLALCCLSSLVMVLTNDTELLKTHKLKLRKLNELWFSHLL